MLWRFVPEPAAYRRFSEKKKSVYVDEIRKTEKMHKTPDEKSPTFRGVSDPIRYWPQAFAE